MTIQDTINTIMNSEEKKKEMIDLFKRHTTDFKWISDNRKDLRERYLNTYIAVRNQRVILSDKNRMKLVDLLKKEYGDIRGITIEYIRDKPLRLLL